MELIVSIFMRELITRPRRRMFYTKRVAYVLGALAFLFVSSILADPATRGLSIFMTLSYTSLVAMYVLPLFIASSMVMQERKDRTLGLLFMTDLRGTTIVTGKFLTALFSALLILGSVFPLFILTTILGGVQAEQVTKAFSILLGTTFLATSAGLFTGTVAKSERTVTWMIFGIALLVFALIPGIVALLSDKDPILLASVAGWHAMTLLRTGVNIEFVHLNTLYCIIVGTPFLIASYVLLPRRAINKSSASSQHVGTTTALKGNPIFWRELNFTLKATPGNRRRTILVILILAILVFGGLLLANLVGWVSFTTSESVMIPTAVFSGLCGTIFCLSGLWSSCGTFYNERTDRTLDVLLTAPVTEKQIAVGKFKAVAYSELPWLIGSLIPPLLLAFTPGYVVFGWSLVAIAIAVYSIWYSFAQLAMWFSLRYKRPVALSACFATWVGWQIVGQSVLLPVMLFGLLSGELIGGSSGSSLGQVITILIIASIYGALHVGLGMIFQQILITTIRLTALRPSSQAVEHTG